MSRKIKNIFQKVVAAPRRLSINGQWYTSDLPQDFLQQQFDALVKTSRKYIVQLTRRWGLC